VNDPNHNISAAVECAAKCSLLGKKRGRRLSLSLKPDRNAWHERQAAL